MFRLIHVNKLHSEVLDSQLYFLVSLEDLDKRDFRLQLSQLFADANSRPEAEASIDIHGKVITLVLPSFWPKLLGFFKILGVIMVRNGNRTYESSLLDFDSFKIMILLGLSGHNIDNGSIISDCFLQNIFNIG